MENSVASIPGENVDGGSFAACGLIAVAKQLTVRLRVESLVMAMTDELTGISNRRAFEETMVRELASAERADHPLSLVLLDLDRFKQMNDSLGCVIGDALMQSVAQRLVGAWELVHYEVIAADGSKRPGAYDRGQISYDASGRMSAQLMNSANKADQAPQTDEARATAYRRYLGYYGPFVVDESKGIVTHIVEGSSNPSWVGSRQVRYYELSADNAQLTLSLRDNAGRTTQALVWKRSK